MCSILKEYETPYIVKYFQLVFLSEQSVFLYLFSYINNLGKHNIRIFSLNVVV